MAAAAKRPRSTETETSPVGWAAWILSRADGSFGIASYRLLVLIAMIIALCPIEFATGPRNPTPATVFFWLPTSLLRSGIFFTAIRCCLIGTCLLWLFKIVPRISAWLTVLFAVLMWSLRMENLSNGAHIFTVVNMLLVIHALWFQFYHVEINQFVALKSNPDQTTLNRRSLCYPRWVFWLSIFYIGWFHSLAGFSKIATTGFGWGNGVSLQLWTKLFGWGPSPFGQLLLWDTRLTAVMQTGALLIECACVLVIINRWFRYGLGLAIFGFYLGVLTTFVDFGFHFNAILVAWFLLPMDCWFGLEFEGVGQLESLPPDGQNSS